MLIIISCSLRHIEKREYRLQVIRTVGADQPVYHSSLALAKVAFHLRFSLSRLVHHNASFKSYKRIRI